MGEMRQPYFWGGEDKEHHFVEKFPGFALSSFS
jgi:hypothetical protein